LRCVWAWVGQARRENARKLQTYLIWGVAFEDQITMAGSTLAGEFLKTRNTEEV
jgi:hypothetical protein